MDGHGRGYPSVGAKGFSEGKIPYPSSQGGHGPAGSLPILWQGTAQGAGIASMASTCPTDHDRKLCFAIDRLILGEALWGEGATWTITGRMAFMDKAEGLLGELHMERMDGARGLAQVSWSVRGTDPVLTFDLRAEDAGDGLIRAILGTKEMGAITISLHGEGPVREWNSHSQGRETGNLRDRDRLADGEEGHKTPVKGHVSSRRFTPSGPLGASLQGSGDPVRNGCALPE